MAGSSSTTNTLSGFADMFRLGFEDWEFQTKRSFQAIRSIVLQIEAASMCESDFPCYVEAQPSAGRKLARRHASIEALKNPSSLNGRNGTASITNPDICNAILRCESQ